MVAIVRIISVQRVKGHGVTPDEYPVYLTYISKYKPIFTHIPPNHLDIHGNPCNLLVSWCQPPVYEHNDQINSEEEKHYHHSGPDA
jgi:hypothetical protein